MSLVSHNPSALTSQTGVPSAVAGLSDIAALEPSGLGSPVPQSIFTTDASTRAWRAHVQKLDPQERNILLKYATGSVESFSSLVQTVCTKHRKQSRISKINDLLRPFCKTLGMYIPVASAASQADPYPSSLVIGGIIGLLQISDNFDSYQQLIMKWLSKLSEKAALLTEFDICIYQYDDKIQDILVLIYGDILDFCQKALKLYADEEGKPRSGFIVFGKSLIERFSDTFGEIVDSFDKHIDSYEARAKLCDSRRLMQIYWVVVNSALQQRQVYQDMSELLTAGRIETEARQLQAYQAQASVSQEIREAQRQARKDILDSLLAGKSEAQAQADQRAAELKRAIEKEDRARKEAKKKLVMNWLPSVQFQHIHDERSASVAMGTGTWFRNHEVYQSWKTSGHSDLLWVKGKPGCGKSVLAALTWEELKPLQNDNTAVARFYCDSSNPERSSYLYLLTTLLKQISGQSPLLHRDLEQTYDKEGLIQDRGPGANEVEKLLPIILSGFAQAFIVIDGLDELRDPMVFLKVLPLLLREATCTLKVIVFCRDYLPEQLPTQNTIKHHPQLHVDQGANKDDIATFISSKLSLDDPDWDTELLDVVKTVLLDRADGMFLYVSLMVGRLRGSLSQNEIVGRLKSLPKGLTKAYEANLKRILNQEEEEDKILTLRILLWIANANRSLSRKELLEALSIRCGTKEKDTGGTDRDFTTFCAELVYFDHDDFYHLVHTSLRDYLFEIRNSTSLELEDYRVMQLHAERLLAEACLTYLLYEQFKTGPVRTSDDLTQLLKENPFLRYAAHNWGIHVALAAEDAPADLVWQFVDSVNARNLSMQVTMAEENVYPFPGSSSPLHMLAYFGLSTFANERLELRALKGQVDGFGLSPLDYAMTERGRAMCLWLLETEEDSIVEARPIMARYSACHIAVILEWNDVLERLIHCGYDINFVSSNRMRTPLAEAAAQSKEKAVKRLLEAGADVNAKDAEGKNPLMIALEGNYWNLALPLLHSGTDVDAQDDDGVSALHLAVDNGNLEAVKMLLERRPRLKRTSEKYWSQTPLHLAAEHDHDEIFAVLHSYGAELESTCMQGFRSIHIAAFHNSLNVARLLVSLGAEMNPLSDDKRTVLHIAAEYSSVEFVGLLLTIDPDVNAKEEEAQNTALHAAAAVGATAICKVLLEQGAVVDLPNITKHTALHLSVIEGHLETAKLLLDHEFSPMKIAVFDSPVLHYAANEGNKDFIQPLIQSQADPEAANLHGHRALHFAARVGNDEFVEQLCTAVTDLNTNSRDQDGKTALHLAAAAGHSSTVQLLQEKGAESDILDSSKNLPIHYAAWDGHVHIVEILISDANMNVRGYSGRTLLSIGALRGHENIVRLLLDRNAMLELGDDGQSTPLMTAVSSKHDEIAQLLISKEANIYTTDGGRRTLLHAAARNGNYDMVRFLLDGHCDAHAASNFGDTPFLDAVFSNDVRIIDHFFDHGVDGCCDQNKLGITSVHAAAEEGNLQMLAKLLDAGAKADLSDRIGRSGLYVAANEGRHTLVEPLLSLGLGVDGYDNCYWTPLGAACENGYVRFAQLLLQHGANIHISAKDTKMTPLHYAAAMHKPQLIRILVDLGADIFSRDCFANSALDYASTHPASFDAIKYDDTQYVTLTLADRRPILWRSIRHEVHGLLSLSKPLTVETEFSRLMKIAVLGKSFRYLHDTDQYETIKCLYMEIVFQPKSADLQLSLYCDICSTSLNHSELCICTECHNTYLCNRCLENYKKGWKAPNSAPEGIKELEHLEKQVEPLRQAMLPVIDTMKLQYVFLIFSFFTAVQAWADTKRKEYEAWEIKFNEDGLYKSRKRPCQELLKLLEEGRVLTKSIEERGLSFNEQMEDCAALARKFSDYHRKYNVLQEDDGFDCSGHEFLQVSKKEYNELCLDRHIFQSDRRLTDEWFRELLQRCPSLEEVGEMEAEPDSGLHGDSSNLTVALQEPADAAADVLSESFNDGFDTGQTVLASSQHARNSKEPPKDEDTSDKGSTATEQLTKVPASSRPKMPQGLRSSFTQRIILHSVVASEDQVSAVDNNAVIEELRSPTVVAAAFSKMEGEDDEASTARTSNTERFTAELLKRHRSLKRRITSPKFDTEDPFEDPYLKRRATTPFPGVKDSREWTIVRPFKESQQPHASEATITHNSASLIEASTLTQEPDALPVSQETPAESTGDGEQKVSVCLSYSDQYGRLVMLALTVAESISPGFGDLFITARFERGDLADYSLQLEVVKAAEGEPGGGTA